jgi:hypothetical protein
MSFVFCFVAKRRRWQRKEPGGGGCTINREILLQNTRYRYDVKVKCGQLCAAVVTSRLMLRGGGRRGPEAPRNKWAKIIR